MFAPGAQRCRAFVRRTIFFSLTTRILDRYPGATCQFLVLSGFCKWPRFVVESFLNFFFHLPHEKVRDSLKFRISYRMLREGENMRFNVSNRLDSFLEVEALIESSVEQVLSSSTALLAERVELVNKLVEALEQDSAWVEMYGMSGELNVPEAFGELGETDEPLRQVIKV
jgi:hypothetical protein